MVGTLVTEDVEVITGLRVGIGGTGRFDACVLGAEFFEVVRIVGDTGALTFGLLTLRFDGKYLQCFEKQTFSRHFVNETCKDALQSSTAETR